MRIASVLEITTCDQKVVNKKSSRFSDFARKTACAPDSVHPLDPSSIVSVVVPYPIHPFPLLLSATEGGEIEIVVRAD
jgi:hypothetical protein